MRPFSRGKDLSKIKENYKPQEKKDNEKSNEIAKIVKFLEEGSKDPKEVDKNVQSKDNESMLNTYERSTVNLDQLVIQKENNTVNATEGNKRPTENPQQLDKQIKKMKLSSSVNPINENDNSKLKIKLKNNPTKPFDKTEEKKNITRKLIKEKVKETIDQRKEMKNVSAVEERVVNYEQKQNTMKTAEREPKQGISISANHPILSELIKTKENTATFLENNLKTKNEKTTENSKDKSAENVSQEIGKTVVEAVEKCTSSILNEACEEKDAEETRVGSKSS